MNADAFGPAEYLVIGFDRSQVARDIVEALLATVGDGGVRLLDLVFVARGEDSGVSVIEVDEIARELELAGVELHLGGLAAEEDIAVLAERVAPGSLAAVALVEHSWASALSRRLNGAGAGLLHSRKIPARALHAHLTEYHPRVFENGAL